MPSPNGPSGQRNERGQFTKGNAGGPGNPYSLRVAELRAALLNAVSPGDMRAIVAKLIEQARAGDIAAARTIFDRTLGRPLEADILARIEALEEDLS